MAYLLPEEDDDLLGADDSSPFEKARAAAEATRGDTDATPSKPDDWLSPPKAKVPGQLSAPPLLAAPDAPAKDEALLAAQKHGRRASRRANLGRASDELIAAFGGYKPDASYWDNLEKQGGQGVADLLQGRSQGRLDKQDVRQDRMDTRQERLDAQGEALNAAKIAKLSQEKKPGRYGMLESVLGIPTGSLDGSDASTVKEIVGAVQSGNTLKAAQLAKEEERKWQTGEHSKDRASHIEAARIGATAREANMGLRKEKFEYTKSQNNTAGFEQDPDNPHVMQASEAKELGEANSARNNIDDKSKEALEILDRNKGVPLNPSSNDYSKLRLLMGEMLPLLTTSSGMKSFTEGHAHVFTDAMGDPLSFANLINSGRMRTQLQTLQHSAHVAVDKMANSMGQREAKRPPPGTGGSGNAGAPATKGGTVRMINPDDGKAYDVDPSEAAEAEANHWKRVR